MFDPVDGDPLGQFFGRHAGEQFTDCHPEVACEAEVEAALGVAAAEP
jgi:hypothetical protein